MQSLVSSLRSVRIVAVLAAIAILSAFDGGACSLLELRGEEAGNFLEQYKAHLEKWEQVLGHADAQGVLEAVSTQPKKRVKKNLMKLRMYTNHQKLRIDITSPDSPGWGSSIVADSSSIFAVSRSAEAAAYRLDEYGDNKNAAAYEYLARKYGGSILKCPIFLGPMPMRDLIDSPDFVVKRLTRSEEGGNEAIRVDFAQAARADRVGLNGWFVLSGPDDWGVKEFEFSSTQGTTYEGKGSVQYQGSRTSNPLPKAWHYHSFERRPIGNYESDQNFAFANYESAAIPDTAFRPEAFGLGHVASKRRSGPATIEWIFLVAVVLLSIGFLLLWVSRRLNPTLR